MKNRYEIKDNTVIVYLNHKGKELESYFDLADLPFLQSLPNTLTVQASGTSKALYVRHKQLKNGKHEQFLIHKALISPPVGFQCDHEDRNTLNNKRSNLRIVTASENLKNRDKFTRVSPPVKGEYIWYAEDRKSPFVFEIKHKVYGRTRKYFKTHDEAVAYRNKWFKEQGLSF